jgi:hypothetical protein
MIAGYEIAVAIPADIPGIIALQDANQPDRGGILSVRFPHEWILASSHCQRGNRGGTPRW